MKENKSKRGKKGDKALIKSTSDALKGLIEQNERLEKSNDAKEN